MSVEEPERGDRDDDRTGRETPFPRQVKQIRPDLRWPKTVRRFAKVTGEPKDIRDVHTLRVRCQVADLHVGEHKDLWGGPVKRWIVSSPWMPARSCHPRDPYAPPDLLPLARSDWQPDTYQGNKEENDLEVFRDAPDFAAILR
jgi:hypothetical protein